MKISLNWLKEYTKIDLPIDDLVQKIGAQLGAVEEVIDLGAKYKGAVVAKVIVCVGHPNADKLHVCMIDDGGVAKDVPRDENGFVQVVCGANNVATGQSIIWLPPGVIVPETFNSKEPFDLTAKELRGILSQGMIASARELDFGDDHDGIIVLDQDANPGMPITKTFWLDDYIIDIENKMFTHRPDCFGMLGIAREVAGIQQQPFKSPDWYLSGKLELGDRSSVNLPLVIKNELPDLVPRFMAVAMSNIKIAKSPLWLQTFLARLGVKSLNNVVDITNFMMLLTGQPLHAYDYDKVKAQDEGATGATLKVRYPIKNEKLILLGGKEIEPRAEAIIIATATEPIGLGGVMGGEDTEVGADTKNIILECANFDMYSIRRTAMEHGLFTDAFTRFSKGQSPLQNDKVLAKAIKMMQELAGGQVASEIIDDKHFKEQKNVEVTPEFINTRLGFDLSAIQIADSLTNVEFNVVNQEGKLIITPPFWRTDIEIPEDIVEEVGRLIGYDKLPIKLPTRSLNPAKKDELLDVKHQIRQILASAGANELLTYSFVHGKLIDKTGQNKELAYQLSNALSPDLQYYRMSILPSLLDKIHPNIKAGFGQFAIFEIGKTHLKNWLDEEKLPKEEDRLGFVFASSTKTNNDYCGAAYYQAQYYLKDLLCRLGIKAKFLPLPQKSELAVNEQLSAPFALQRSAIVLDATSGVLLGAIGEFKPRVRKTLKLPNFSAGFEIDLNQVLLCKDSLDKYIPLPKYPKVEQDVTLKVPVELSFANLFDAIFSQMAILAPYPKYYFDIKPLDIYQHPDDPDHKQISLRVVIASYQGTLKSQEVNELLDKIALKVGTTLKAQRI